LKNDPLTQDIPLVILTSKDNAAALYWGLDTGVDRFLLKKTKPAELLQAVQSLLPEPLRARREGLRALSQWDVVEKLNNTLDQKLLESKLVNTFAAILSEVGSLEETVAQLFGICSRILDFSLSAFFSLSEEATRVTFHLRETLSEEAFQAIQLYLFRYALESNYDIGENIDVRVEGSYGTLSAAVDPDHFLLIPIRLQKRNIGLLAFYVRSLVQMPPETKALLTQAQQAISLVINNVVMMEKIKRISAMDGLTNIYNRRYFMEFLEKEMERTRRMGLTMSLILFDIDNFKSINDQYNHLSGDLVLKHVAKLFKQSIRKMDIPARYGGEEFIALLPETGPEAARVVSERIRNAIATFGFHSFDRKPIQVTVSVGVTTVRAEHLQTNPLEVIKQADTLLYKAKASGKNRVCQ
jgi:diguanylate cyclase (GGDEF)-like protein